MAVDWNGREIQEGDYVRHVYEPWPADKHVPNGKGYHMHFLAGKARVVTVGGITVEVAAASRCIPIFLGKLLEVVDPTMSDGDYTIPLSGPYREPTIS